MSRRILIVDDDHAMVRTLCDILRLRGVPIGKRDYEGQLRIRST